MQKKVEEVEDQLHLFDALLVRSATKVTEELFEKMTKLKIVGRAGVGVDNIDIEAATKHDQLLQKSCLIKFNHFIILLKRWEISFHNA
ncbi:MAG: hypothetical protein ACQEWV_04390 [Bacillota bacterium]